MPRPRVLDYDDLHGYLEAQADDANAEIIDAGEEGDHERRQFHAGRLSAFTDLLAHIERELEAYRA